MRSLFPLYLLGLASWFVPLGIQTVLFSWLAAIVLHMDAFAVGIAQMALMAPAILFLPLGGLVADRGNARRLLLSYHFFYALPPLVLAGVLSLGGLSYPLLIAYGLAAGVWTQSLQRTMYVTERLKAGTIYVNNYRATRFTTPFGGFKRSGIGRESGPDAIKEYLDIKTVWLSSDLDVPNPFIRR